MTTRHADERASQPTRRQVLAAAGLGVAAGMVPADAAGAADSRPGGQIITREIPRGGGRLPAVGLGTFNTFDTLPGAPRRHLREVVRRYWDGGARVFDVSPLYGRAEHNLGDIGRELGVTDRMFITDKTWVTGEYLWDDGHAETARRESVRRLHRRTPIDVLQCHSLVNVDVVVPLLHAWKKEGRVRYVGVSHHDPVYFGPLLNWTQRGDLDFVQVHYSIHTRVAEEEIIPAAAANGTAVLVNMPLEKARLHAVVGNRPLPAFATDFGIRSWSEYFLKWVLGNPDVTCVLPSTSDPAHAAENVAAMRGPLPDQDMRARMVEHLESVPGFDQIATMPWYPRKTFSGVMAREQARLRARSPWWAS
ncbi:aldo/keto reductase [Micromonospora sp. 15K316]|uniref:aldo/keto reductase n=1 Tax=Micromonospora sp. 15K316 TaxID=2530376 RepID=UPI0010470E77|nr:aldo/keto reductase [Micromonospora sp. 15K316]TDC30350.1 aldo/keto reductase [Micromonospora sp. 15K316]